MEREQPLEKLQAKVASLDQTLDQVSSVRDQLGTDKAPPRLIS